jgi:hypothetical protein
MMQNSETIKDIYGIWYELPWIYTFMERLVLVFFLGVLGVFFYFLYIQYRSKKVVINCAEKALHELLVLQQTVIHTEDDGKKAYFKVSLLIKEYLSSRYHTQFVHLTDKELVVQVALYMPEDCVDIVRQIFYGMTFIKFEHQLGIVEKLKKDIDLCMNLIKKTTFVDTTKGN